MTEAPETEPERVERADSLAQLSAERATVLSDQRIADLSTAAAAELARAREQGKQDALNEQNQKETQKRFDLLNGSLQDTATALAAMVAEFAAFKAALAQRDAVNAALVKAQAEAGAKKLSRFQLGLAILGGLGVAVSVFAFVVQAI